MQEERARQGGDTFAEPTNIFSSIVVIKPLSTDLWHDPLVALCYTGKKECTVVIFLTETWQVRKEVENKHHCSISIRGSEDNRSQSLSHGSCATFTSRM